MFAVLRKTITNRLSININDPILVGHKSGVFVSTNKKPHKPKSDSVKQPTENTSSGDHGAPKMLTDIGPGQFYGSQIPMGMNISNISSHIQKPATMTMVVSEYFCMIIACVMFRFIRLIYYRLITVRMWRKKLLERYGEHLLLFIWDMLRIII